MLGHSQHKRYEHLFNKQAMVWAFLTVLDRFFSFILNEIARRLDTKKAAFAAGCQSEINAKKSPVLL